MRFGLFIMGTRKGSYVDIIDQVQYAEELGFDTVVLGERHFTHGDLLYPSPFSMAAAFAAKTTRIRIGMAARVLSLDHPLHIAEDSATLDTLSGGRLDFGATRASHDEECHVAFRSPLEESRSRLRESLEVIKRAWTEEKFSYEGQYYNIPEVSVYPKPLQKPHPPISIVTVTEETLSFAAEKGYSAIIGAIRSPHELKDTAEIYWKAFNKAGNNRGQAELKVNRFIYISDTDKKARIEIERPFMDFIKNRAPDLKAALISKYGREEDFRFDRFVSDFCLFGSPSTVTLRIKELGEKVDLTHLLCSLNFITLDHALCIRSMELFAREVMPSFVPSNRHSQYDGSKQILQDR
jgi:alkanesulfonate monooxygenase SsuD/methylene tetrahydromethanopterin reductase-like flavin-dependent oxidoreductase (luciferase family)